MRKAGCGSLLYGIESGSQRILNKMHKGTTLAEIKKVLKLTMNENIWPLTYWLVGFPSEQISDIKKTKDFIISGFGIFLNTYKLKLLSNVNFGGLY